MHFSKFHLSQKWQRTSLVVTAMISILAVALVISGYKASHRRNGDIPKPHILLIILGDVGNSDVSWNNPGVKSPNLETLLRNGIRLEQYHTHPTDYGSRAELLTGKYLHRLKGGLALNRTGISLAGRLGKLDYMTHFIGKWQLDEYTPAQMGFKSFYGSIGGNIDSWTKCRQTEAGMNYDWTLEEGNVTQAEIHANDLITDHTVSVIEGHNQDLPLFLITSFIPPRVIHQTPEMYKRIFENRNDVWRQEFLAYIKHLDDAVNKIIEASEQILKGEIYTIIMSDGGPASAKRMSNRYPLRGGAGSVFEGGIRVPALITGRHIDSLTFAKSVHVTDWMPTIMSLARSPLNSSFDDYDGIDLTRPLELLEDSANSDQFGPCRDIVHDINALPFNYSGIYPAHVAVLGNVSSAAISCWPYKLVLDIPGVNDQWADIDILWMNQKWRNGKNNGFQSVNSTNPKCNGSIVIAEKMNSDSMDPKDVHIYLFNLKDDPEEAQNIGEHHPDMFNNLLHKLSCHANFIVFPFQARHQCIQSGPRTS